MFLQGENENGQFALCTSSLTVSLMVKKPEQGKSEGFDSCDQPSNLAQIGLKSSIFQPMWPSNLTDDLEKL